MDSQLVRSMRGLWAGIALLWAVAVLVLLFIGRRLGRVSRLWSSFRAAIPAFS